MVMWRTFSSTSEHPQGNHHARITLWKRVAEGDQLGARSQDLYMIDHCCDEEVVPIYEPHGFKQSIGMVLRNYDRQSAGV